MSDAAEPPSGDPTDDAPPDLAGDASEWDAPLPDLAGADAPLTDLAGGEPVAVPPLPAGAAGTDPWAPVVPMAFGGDADLAGAPTAAAAGRSGRTRRRRADRAPRDPSPRRASGPAAGGPVPDGSAAPAPARGPSAAPGADRARGTAADPPGTAEAGGPAEPSGPAAPRGLESGPPVVGLEPGTLFGPELGRAETMPGEPRRRSRRRRGANAASDADAPAGPERLPTAEERIQHALKLAYRYLSKRDRTVSEVRTHLEGREVDEASIATALAELVEFGYLDDARYAARFVEDKRRLEGWGHLRIEQGLRRTGVPREIADRALEEDPLRGDENELAVEALEQRLRGRAPEDDRARQKALRLLATKGYPLETAYAAVRAYERRCAQHGGD